jgi:hypothetical protein
VLQRAPEGARYTYVMPVGPLHRAPRVELVPLAPPRPAAAPPSARPSQCIVPLPVPCPASARSRISSASDCRKRPRIASSGLLHQMPTPRGRVPPAQRGIDRGHSLLAPCEMRDAAFRFAIRDYCGGILHRRRIRARTQRLDLAEKQTQRLQKRQPVS